MDQHLQVFITVVEKENFSRAAEEHHMTQPAVSQYIRALEEQIGSKLLERSNKYVHLNKAGKIVYHHGKEILGLYERMQHLVDDLTQKASGTLAIGASYTFGEYVLPHIIAQMRDLYPDIELTVTIGNTAQIAAWVESHQLDIGIVEGKFKNTGLIQEIFAEDAMVIVASPEHPLVKIESIEADILSRQTWLLREQGSGTRQPTERLIQRLAISPAHRMEYSSTQPIKESVEAGLGISLLSKWAIQKELKHGDLTVIEQNELPLKRSFSFIRQSPFQTKALEVFIALLNDSKTLISL